MIEERRPKEPCHNCGTPTRMTWTTLFRGHPEAPRLLPYPGPEGTKIVPYCNACRKARLAHLRVSHPELFQAAR